MDHHSQHALMTLLALLFCTCMAVALPAARPEVTQGDLSHLVKLIGKLKTLNTQTHDDAADNWVVDNDTADVDNGSNTRSASATGDNIAALKQGFLGFNKRQGAWSYDYGLGGGRFGKRYYGDYGIGGGRFGRDVDHVDVADTNDATL